MKISSTSQTLSLALQAFQSAIVPNLTSADARAAAEAVEFVLKDTIKRHGPAIALLRSVVSVGERLEADMLEALDQPTAIMKNSSERESFEDLSQQYEKLMKRLVELSTILCTGKSPRAPALLRRAAEWDYSYYEKLTKIEAESYYKDLEPSESGEHLLSQESFEKFLVQRRGPLRVTRFDRLEGGHGNQTYLAEVHHDDGKAEKLIVRRADEKQLIMWGMFLIDQQFLLLKSLSKTDYPSPHVYDFGDKSSGIPGGKILTMSYMPGKPASTYLGSGKVELSESMAFQLAELLAKLHSYPLETFSDFFEANGLDPKDETQMTVEETYRRSISQWEQYLKNVEHLPSTYLLWLLNWMKNNIPKDGRSAVLVHGDFSIHNIMQQEGKVAAVLDWECANFGAAEQDLAYIQPVICKSMPWQKFLDHYLKSGGREVNKSLLPFCQAYTVLKTSFAFSRAALNTQKGYTQDARLLMSEFAFQPIFMRMGLQAVPSEISPANDLPKAVRKPTTTVLPYPTDETSIMQPIMDDPYWQDSVVLVWWSKENSVGGFHRLGHEPGHEGGVAVLWSNFASPEGHFKRTQTKRLRPEDVIPGGGFGSGDDTCTMEYKDEDHIFNFNEPEGELTCALIHKDTGPNVDCFPKSGAISTDMAKAHLDIPGIVTGTLTIKGKTYHIRDGLSVRDRGYGRREWGQALLSHRWVVGSCGPKMAVFAVAWHSASNQMFSFGWMVRDNVVTVASKVDIVTYFAIDSASNIGGRVDMELVTGETFKVECTPVAKAFHSVHRGIDCVDRICSFHVTGEGQTFPEGFGDFESTVNPHLGTRDPVKIDERHGVLANGFTAA